MRNALFSLWLLIAAVSFLAGCEEETGREPYTPVASAEPVSPQPMAEPDPALPNCRWTVLEAVANCDGLQQTEEFFDCAQLYVPSTPKAACGGRCLVDPASPWSDPAESWWDGFERIVWLALERSPEVGDPVPECDEWDAWAQHQSESKAEL